MVFHVNIMDLNEIYILPCANLLYNTFKKKKKKET
jgi:hypothetical protein